MEDSAKVTQNQLSFTAPLETEDTFSVQTLSPHWPAVVSKLDTWTREMAVALAAKAAYLYILDERQQLLRPYFSWPVRTNKSYFTERAIGEGIAGLTAQSKRLVRVDKFKNNKSTEPDWPHQSTLAVPLILEVVEQPLGVLVIADKIDQPTFSPQDEQILLSLVNQTDTASIIKSANLVNRKRDRGQELTALGQISQTLNNSLHLMDVASVCQAILQIPDLKNIFQFDVAEICLWNPQTKTLTTALRMVDGSPDVQAFARTYHLNEGYTGWIAAHQKSLLIEDTQRYTGATPRSGLANFPYRAYLGVPLKIGAKLLGTLELVAAPIGAFESSDATMLEIVANHAAVAIDYALLFQETQRNLSKLSLLFDASHELSSTLSYEELLADLSSQMAEAFSADKCAVYNFDETSGILTLVQQYLKSNGENHSSHSDQEALPLTVSKFPALQAALKERSLLIVRLDDSESALHETEWLKQQKCGAMVAIPLFGRDKVTGLVLLFSVNPRAFTEDEIWLAQSLASQVNIAIENALLFNLTDQQLQTRVNELAGLQRVSGELNSTLDLNRILDIVLEEAIHVTKADFGNVNLYDTQTGNLVAHKEQNWPANASTDGDKFPSPTTAAVQKFMDRALKTGQAVLVPDVSKEKDYFNLINSTRSKVVVPIFYGGEPAGVINLESKQLNFFNNDQLRYLEALANQAAVAMGNTQAYQEQKRERERANRRADQLARLSEISNAFRTNRPLPEILEDVAYAIVETVGYSVVLVSLVEGNPPLVRPKVGAGIPIAQLEILQHEAQQPLTNLQAIMLEEFRLSNSYFIPVERMEVWQGKLDIPQVEVSHPTTYLLDENKELTSNTEAAKYDAWQPGDVLFIPLTDTEDNTIGLLTVANPDTDERPDILHVQTLEIFANHAATAIENARLFELEQQRRRLADTLRGVAETISSQLEFEELLNIVLQELAKVINYDSASVQLLKEDQLVIIGGRGWEDSQQVIGTAFSMEGNNPNRRVIETQEPLIVGNAPLAYPEGFSRPPHNRIKSWLGVPLTYGINVLGLMAVESYTQYNFFTQEDAKVVLAFASQVAVALQNARLFEEARQQVRQLAALTEVAQSISRALNLNEVLNLVLDAVFDLAGQSKGSIWLIDHASHTVKIADTKNVPSFLVELFNQSAISVDSEPFASVIQSGQVLVIGGFSGKDDIAHYGLPFPDDVTYVPLKTEAGVIGILAIEVVIHNKNMLKLVTTLADLAAIAIDNARLLEDTRRRANEMQNLYRLGVEVSGLLDVRQVMGSVVNNALTLTDTQIGTILLWDEETQSYLIDGALNTDDAVAQLIVNEAKESLEIQLPLEGDEPLWSRLTRQIIDTGQPLMLGAAAAVVSDAPAMGRKAGAIPPKNGHSKPALPLGVRAILGVPIQVQNEVSGAIFVCNLAARAFNERDIQLLSFVANQAAVAVRNAQLVQRLNLMTEELERRVAQRTEELAQTLQDLTEERDRVNALYQITRELAASFDLDRVLVEALSLINRAVGISHGSILLLDHETGSLVYRAALGRDKPLPRGGHKTQYRPGYGLAGKIIETRQARIVPDLFMDPDWVSKQDTPDRRSALVVPLITGEDVLGVLLLFHPEINYFTEDHLKLVIAAGAQVATAINNAELYRLITDQAQRLGVMLRTQAAEAAKNQAILKGITDGVLVLDARRNIVLVNPKAVEILSIEAERLENQPIQQSLGQLGSGETPELPYLFYLQLLKALAALEAGESSAEFRVEAGDKVIMATLAPVMLAPDEQPSLVAVLRDISREAEIDRIKNEFISTVSHELRTPMTSIKGYADLLVSGSPQVGELNPIQRRFVQVIQSNANRLTELVNDILEISRIETGRVKLELESLDIIQLINEVAVSFEGQMVKKAMNLALDLPEKLPYVYADKARVTQILVNLIGNAWQYTPEGGDITVHAQVVNHRFIQVDVEDTGIGIVEKDIHYVFDRFFRSERTEVQVVDGTGLGLSITKMFVEMLGGEIWLKSQLDVGTTFSFTLPIDVTHAQVEIPFDEAGTQTQPALLLIDDNVAVANLLKPQLERTGYQVIVATEDENALNLARQAQPTLKLIMLNLLKNGDSFALLERLRQDEVSGAAPILLTSLGTDESGQDLAVEMVDYIGQPFTEAQVLERVRWVLTLATGETQEIGPAGMPSSRNGRYQILVVAHNQSTVKWFKETLEAHGYKVQRAFNSQQALDIAAGDKPDLVLIDLKMPDVEGASLISQLRRTVAPKRLPVIGIVDQPVPKQENNDKIKMLGRENWTKMKHPFVTDVLVAEIVQIGAQAGAKEDEKQPKFSRSEFE